MSRRGLLILTSQIILFSTIIILFFSAKNFMATPTNTLITTIDSITATIDGEITTIDLPHTFHQLEPNTPVTLTTTIIPTPQDVLYVTTTSSPLNVYANGSLIYQLGEPGTYPSFFLDPPTESALVSIPFLGTNEEITLTLEYLSPTTSNTLVLSPLFFGAHTIILRKLIENMGFYLLLSIVQLWIGVLLVAISLVIIAFTKEGIVFFWLGLFSLATGAWAFGDCNLTGIFITNHSLLYLFTYIGFFIFTIPMISFVMSAVNFKNPKPLYIAILIITTVTIIAFILQLFGVVSFSNSINLFYCFVPLACFLLAWCCVWEALRYTSIDAARFVLPVTVLATTSALEVLNFEVPITYLTIPIFQLGILFFIISTAILGGLYIRDVLAIKNEKQQLHFQMNLMQYQLEDQKKHSLLLTNNAEQLKQQRHDLKHQLTVIQSLNEKHDYEELSKYLDTLLQKIPTSPTFYCSNETVNAVISHYASICKQENITFTTKLIIPDNTDPMFNSNLCIIFGNLLENAIEACRRLSEANKFILLNSQLRYHTLIITMDNSFNGSVTKINGKFCSMKRNDYGVGLSSIISVAQTYEGDASFEVDGTKFMSSVYLNLNNSQEMENL